MPTPPCCWAKLRRQPSLPLRPAAPAAAAPARPAAPAAAKPAPAMPAVSQVARTGSAVKYVGTPAVGTSKAAAAGGVSSGGRIGTEIDSKRRRLVWAGVVAFLATWLLAFFRFFLPRTLFEPSTVFKIGYPSDFGLGVDTKLQQTYRIWVDRTPGRLFVIYASCTHLGCTPDWKPAKTSSSAPATAAATTAKASTSRARRRAPWTARTSSSLPTARSSWTPAACIMAQGAAQPFR